MTITGYCDDSEHDDYEELKKVIEEISNYAINKMKHTVYCEKESSGEYYFNCPKCQLEKILAERSK